MEQLSGKTALVTGSTDGVGRLVARKLGQAGARVLVHGRDAERGARVVADIEASGGAADFLAADLSALAEVRRLADAAQARVDRLDILINNAGIGTAGPRHTSAEGERRQNHHRKRVGTERVLSRDRFCGRAIRRPVPHLVHKGEGVAGLTVAPSTMRWQSDQQDSHTERYIISAGPPTESCDGGADELSYGMGE